MGKKEALILVVDDGNVRRLVQRTLELEGYNVLIASGGREALEKLKEDGVSLVLLDIMMPGRRVQ